MRLGVLSRRVAQGIGQVFMVPEVDQGWDGEAMQAKRRRGPRIWMLRASPR